VTLHCAGFQRQSASFLIEFNWTYILSYSWDRPIDHIWSKSRLIGE
jgi:hypothetical protein